jgi:hypothetical protein
MQKAITELVKQIEGHFSGMDVKQWQKSNKIRVSYTACEGQFGRRECEKTIYWSPDTTWESVHKQLTKWMKRIARYENEINDYEDDAREYLRGQTDQEFHIDESTSSDSQ